MKALIVKELEILSLSKPRLIMILLFLGIALIPTLGSGTYIVIVTIISGMLVSSSFSYDESNNWNVFALSMPLSRKDIVASKFVSLLVLTIMGMLSSLIFSVVITAITSVVGFEAVGDTLNPLYLALMAATGFSLSLLYGSLGAVFSFKYGNKHNEARFLMVSIIPTVTIILGAQVMSILGVNLTEFDVSIGVGILILLALAGTQALLSISYRIISKKEF